VVRLGVQLTEGLAGLVTAAPGAALVGKAGATAWEGTRKATTVPVRHSRAFVEGFVEGLVGEAAGPVAAAPPGLNRQLRRKLERADASAADGDGQQRGRGASLALFGASAGGLVAGGAAWLIGRPDLAAVAWIGGTLVVLVPATVAMGRKLLRREGGVDAIAVLAMGGALLLGERSSRSCSPAGRPWSATPAPGRGGS